MAIPTPLTTIFTPAAACFTEIHYEKDQAVYLGPGIECVPQGPNPTLSSYFSPGLYCPESFTVACSTEVTIGSATETRATCCPRADGVGRLAGHAFSCQAKTGAIYDWYATFGCTLQFGSLVDQGPFTLTVTDGASTFVSSITALSGQGVNAYSVALAWQASDTQTQPTSSLTMSSATSSASRTAAESASSTAPVSAAPSSGLSESAKIAIGVVVPVVVLVIIIGAFWYMRRAKKRRSDQFSAPFTTTYVDHPKDAKSPYELNNSYATTNRYEMNGDGQMQDRVWELGTNTRPR